MKNLLHGSKSYFLPNFYIEIWKKIISKRILMCILVNFIGNFVDSKSNFKFEDQRSPVGGPNLSNK